MLLFEHTVIYFSVLLYYIYRWECNQLAMFLEWPILRSAWYHSVQSTFEHSDTLFTDPSLTYDNYIWSYVISAF